MIYPLMFEYSSQIQVYTFYRTNFGILSFPSICEADQDDNTEAAGGGPRSGGGSAKWETVVPEVKVGRFGGMSFTAPPYKVSLGPLIPPFYAVRCYFIKNDETRKSDGADAIKIFNALVHNKKCETLVESL